MFAALSGVPAGTDEESKQAASDAYAPFASDMIWLLEQGFIVVTSDNSIWYPKGSAAPAPAKTEPRRRPKKKGNGNKKPEQPTGDTAAPATQE
jgi:hypothetical protein